MFSAIVAVVLIMTVSVLVGTLVMSEERTSTQIYGMLNNYQLADAANIARADAMQSFNYAFREKMEEYLTYNESKLVTEIGMGLFEIRDISEPIEFSQIQRKFEENILLNTAQANSSGEGFQSVIRFVSESTITRFDEWNYGKYRVELSDKSIAAEEALYNALATSLSRQNESGAGFLEIVDCTEDSCPKGSFYFNIPLSKLTDEEYELIPRIIVQNTFTQEQIKMAILPKTDFKVYVPLRFFKVLREAMDAANGLKAAHAKNAEFKLGFCDYGKCVPRDNPVTAVGESSWNKNCPNSEEAQWVVTLNPPAAGITEYFSGGSSVGVKGLWGYGAEEVCKESIAQNAFEIESSSDTFHLRNTDLAPGTNNQRRAVINGCGYYYLSIGAAPELKATFEGNQKLYCGRITSVIVDIVFVDTDPNFLVKGTSIIMGAKSNMYKIRISDISYDPVINANDADPSSLFSCKSGLDQCTPA